MITISYYCLAVCVLAASSPALFAQVHSALWGRNGEHWSPQSRLPDFSHAGYRRGEASLPDHGRGRSVKEFGAVGDGEHDDTQAFRDAIAAVDAGVIEIPPGRYVITDMLVIRKSDLVLRGAGRDQTTLYFPQTLTDAAPNWGATTSGQRTSNYSWSGGFLRVEGSNAGSRLTAVAREAQRGDDVLVLEDASALDPGMEMMLQMRNDEEHTLTQYLYAGDPGPIDNIGNQIQVRQVFRVRHVQGQAVRVDRPLRFDVRGPWKPELITFEPRVTGVGIEGVTLAFPPTAYQGHFTELGHNGIAMTNVAHCWVRRVRIQNAESGIFLSGRFNTIDDVVFESQRDPDGRDHTGHHGVMLGGEDNLLTNFDFRQRFIHDITVTLGSIGNVSSNGRGRDLSLDHHRRGPYENLFTHIDAGEGTRLWASGGGAALGKHCAARGTFWNIRAKRPIPRPGDGFAPPIINIVGIHTDQSSQTDPEGVWFEAVSPAQLHPQNVHQAQLQRRLQDGKR